MDQVVQLYARARHWQVLALILALWGIAATVGLLGSGTIFETVSMILGVLCYATFYFPMGSFLNSVVPPNLRLNFAFFRINVIFLCLYLVLFDSLFRAITHASSSLLLLMIIPLHLFATFCLFYNLYFVSKSLVLAERGKNVSFTGYFESFILIWFFPFGIWFTQPRINRLYAEKLSQRTA